MSSVKSSWSKWSPVSVAFLALAAFAIPALGQEAADTSAQGGSYVDDWSHHHLVYSNPGTREDAEKNGKLDKWLKITGDPRYQLQLAKRKMGTLPVVADPNLTMAGPDLATETVDAVGGMAARPVAPQRPRPVRGNPIEKDWAQPLGGAITSLVSALAATGSSSTVSASSTITIGTQTFTTAAPATATSGLASIASGGLSSSNIAATSTLTFNTPTQVVFDASPPTQGTQTGAFSALPASATSSAGSITVANTHPLNTLTMTTNATQGSYTATFADTTPPTAATTVTVTAGSNMLTLTNGGSSSSGTIAVGAAYCFAGGDGVKINGIAITCSATKGTGGSVTILHTPPVGDTVTIAGQVYTYEDTQAHCGVIANCVIEVSGDHPHTAENLYAAVNATSSECYGSPTACYYNLTGANATASAAWTTGASDITFSGKCAGAITVATSDATNITPVSGTGSNGTAGTGSFALPSPALNTTVATNMATAIGTETGTDDVTATANSPTSGTVYLTGEYPGTADNVSLVLDGTPTGLTLSGAALTGGLNGSNACSSSTTGTYATSTTASTLAGNVNSAIALCPTTIGFTSSNVSGQSTVKVTDDTFGYQPNTFTVGGAGTSGVFSWSAITNGGNGSNTCPSPFTSGTFQLNTANTTPTTTTAANNLANEISACNTGNANTGITANNTTSTVNATADTPGSAPGITLGSTVTGFTWSGGTTFTNGSDGTTSVVSVNPELFSYWSGYTYATPATLAGTITGLINLNNTLSPLLTATQGTGSSNNQITIAADIPGPSANITVTPSSNFSAFTGGSLSGGTNGPGDTATTFNYWGGQGTTSTYDTGTQLATDLHNALAANGTVPTTDGITTTVGANQITFVTNKAGPFGVSVTNFPGFTGAGSISNAAVTAAVQPNAYPAKYGASLTTANCATDFMVYPTGVAGSATSANIIAYNNLYSSCGNSPTVYWAYNTEYQSNTGYSVTTSPVLSADGTKVAFIESNGSNAYLIVVRWATGGTPGITNPVAPTLATNITTCTAPCMTATQLNFNDNLSSPFYNYNTVGGDEIYVGDTSGNLEQFTGVFNGAVAISTSPWPKNLGAAAITSPILDQGVGVIVVGDMAGALHFVNASTAAIQGTAPGIGDAIIDAPLVDPSTGQAFVFVNVSGAYSYSGYNAVYQYPIGYSGSTIGTPGVNALWSAGGVNGLAAHYIYSGNFDNVYFNSANGTGNMYVVANTGVTTGATLYKVAISGGSLQVGGTSAAATGLTVNAAGAYPWPSPLTEFCNGTCGTTTSGCAGGASTCTAPGSTDYVFFSVNRGVVGSCAPGAAGNGCIMSYNVSSPTSVTPSGEQSYPNPTGNGCWATSGIVIDNASGTTGASQIYFVGLNGAAAGYPGTPTSSGSSGCGTAIAATLQGIQASQPAP